jgi:electron transfer flavoprotein alpha subunit
MSKVLLFIQHDQGKISKGTLISLTAARELQKAWGKTNIVGVALGAGASVAAQAASTLGLESILTSESPLFSQYRAEPYARAVAIAARDTGCDTVVALANSTGKDLLPRVTVLLDGGQVSDIIGVNGDGSLKRPMYAGNVIADVELTSSVKVVSVRSTAFAPAEPTGSATAISELNLASDPELVENSRFGEIVSIEQSKALGSAENFEKIMFPLADVLGAAVGASRAAVDSGYAPNDWQVGQTGKVVAPSLYIAVGVSGAIQHLAGMKDSKVIVAINKDPEAPIFEVADFGLVADLFTVVPELTDAVKALK